MASAIGKLNQGGGTMGIIGRKVIRNTDDQPCPLTGIIVGRIDEDRVEVVWGDAADITEAAAREGCAEWLEDLMTAKTES